MIGDQILHFFGIFFTIRLEFFKSLFFMVHNPSKNNDFLPIKKIVKKSQKNVKFDLQVHFNIEIMLSGLNRLFRLWKRRYKREAKQESYFTTHLSPSLYIYLYISTRPLLRSKQIIFFYKLISDILNYSFENKYYLFCYGKS